MTLRLEESLQRDINRIQGRIHEMANLVERALKTALQGFIKADRQLAYLAILGDQRIDELEKEIDRLCLEFLVRQQPSGRHLRLVYATIKINAELERIGDYAVSVARQIIKVSTLESTPSSERFAALGEISISMLHDAVKAFVEQNADLAKVTMVIEDKADHLRNQIDADLLQHQREGKIPIETFTPLLTVARRFERVADQAKNICEEVVYLCTGEFAKHKGTETIRVLFVDEHNSCRSQVAEAIGNALGQPRLLFASAGIAPQPIDPETVAFLARKGFDISRHTAKSADQLPNLEFYQIVIALDPAGKKVSATLPKAIALDWSVPDPSAVQGPPEKVHAAHEETFQHIQKHIQDLCTAILEPPTPKNP